MDNTGAISLSTEVHNHIRSKHIDVCYHFIHQHIEVGTFLLHWVSSHQNTTNIFTEALSHILFDKYLPGLSLVSQWGGVLTVVVRHTHDTIPWRINLQGSLPFLFLLAPSSPYDSLLVLSLPVSHWLLALLEALYLIEPQSSLVTSALSLYPLRYVLSTLMYLA